MTFAFSRRPRRRPLRTASAVSRQVPDLGELERRLGIARNVPHSATLEELLEVERQALGRGGGA